MRPGSVAAAVERLRRARSRASTLLRRLSLRLLGAKRCKRMRITGFTPEWLVRNELTPAVTCILGGSRTVELVRCRCVGPGCEPPEWLGMDCSCPNGEPYPESVCRVRGMLLGEKEWVIVREVRA